MLSTFLHVDSVYLPRCICLLVFFSLWIVCFCFQFAVCCSRPWPAIPFAPDSSWFFPPKCDCFFVRTLANAHPTSYAFASRRTRGAETGGLRKAFEWPATEGGTKNNAAAVCTSPREAECARTAEEQEGRVLGRENRQNTRRRVHNGRKQTRQSKTDQGKKYEKTNASARRSSGCPAVKLTQRCQLPRNETNSDARSLAAVACLCRILSRHEFF